MQVVQRWEMNCHNGKGGVHQIQIPWPKHLNWAGDPPLLDRDSAETVFACPRCGLVSKYKGSEVHPVLSPLEGQASPPDPVAFCVLLPCVEGGCKPRTKVHTTMENGETKDRVVERLRRARFQATCENGHLLDFPVNYLELIEGSEAHPF